MRQNSEFSKLYRRVDELTSELNRLKALQGNEADIAAQKELLKQSKQQQQAAKNTLLNSNATADELEAAAAFLPTLGLQEQARLDARSKRAAEQLAQPQFVMGDAGLIDAMKASALTGEYQVWRDGLKRPDESSSTAGRQMPNGKTRPSANAMKAAKALANQTFLKDKPVTTVSPMKPYQQTEKRQSTKPVPLSRFFEE